MPAESAYRSRPVEVRQLPLALSVEQAAGLLRIGRSKAYDAVRTGGVAHSHRAGRAVYPDPDRRGSAPARSSRQGLRRGRTAVNGSVFKKCPCTSRSKRGKTCKKDHGSWAFIHDVPALPGAKRRRISRAGFATKTLAQEKLSESMGRFRQRGVAAAQDLRGRGMYLADYLPQWLEDRQNLKASTRASYTTHLRLFLVPHLGHLRLEELRGEDIEAAYRSIRQSRRVGPARIQRVHATLRKALNDAVRRYKYVDFNPAQLVELESVPAPKAKYWNSKQAGAFLGAIVDERLYALFYLVVTRGLRRGEIVALRWADLDLDDGLLEVCRSTVQIGYATEDGTPKSDASNRLIALDEDNVGALKAHRARQQRERLALGAAYQDHGLVFAPADGMPLHPAHVSYLLDVLIKRAGCVPRITFHQLRHTAASLMLEAGADLKYVQHVLGHSSITITSKIYTHVTMRLDRLRSAQVATLIPANAATRATIRERVAWWPSDRLTQPSRRPLSAWVAADRPSGQPFQSMTGQAASREQFTPARAVRRSQGLPESLPSHRPVDDTGFWLADRASEALLAAACGQRGGQPFGHVLSTATPFGHRHPTEQRRRCSEPCHIGSYVRAYTWHV
jgi:integrase